MSDQLPTRQEMFDRAVRGLAGQNWRIAMVKTGCSYLTPDGCRCAWGHVDPEGTVDPDGHPHGGTVLSLAQRGIGLASRLDVGEDLNFARDMQFAHDNAANHNLRERFVEFGKVNGLAWPEGIA